MRFNTALVPTNVTESGTDTDIATTATTPIAISIGNKNSNKDHRNCHNIIKTNLHKIPDYYIQRLEVYVKHEMNMCRYKKGYTI